LRTRTRNAVLLAMVAAALLLAPEAARATPPRPKLPLRHVIDIRLPGLPSRFDYQDVDAARRRLFVAHLGASEVDVVDLDQRTAVGAVDHVAEVHGVRAAPDLGVVYASATGTDEIVAIDATTLQMSFRAPAGDFPDGLAYDPTTARVFVSNTNAGTISVLDARTGQPAQTIKLSGETGNVAYDRADRSIFAAVRPPDELMRVDPAHGAITARTRLHGCRGAHGLYLEERMRLAFIACERNARLAVIDLTTMKQRMVAKVGEDPDVLAYDAELQRLYVATESGIVTIFEVRPSSLVQLGRARLAAHAHSVAVDQTTHDVFFPLQNVNGRPAVRVMQPTGRSSA
jgi:DNA-binding beta-propeller fold protein YncE